MADFKLPTGLKLTCALAWFMVILGAILNDTALFSTLMVSLCSVRIGSHILESVHGTKSFEHF